MRKSTLLVMAVFCLSLTAISQTPRTATGSPQLSTRLSHVDNDIFIYLGKRDNTMHLVWDEVTKERVAYYVVLQSNDGKNFHAVDSLHPTSLFDIFVNDYPNNISYDNSFLYSTETGSGRFIYNDVLTPTERTEVMLWYRIKIVTTKGYDIYTKKMQKAVNTRANPLTGSLTPSLLNNSNLPAQFSGNGVSGNPGGNTNPLVAMRMVGCPAAQAPPAGYIYTGNFQIYYGQCCYWEEREYRLQLITAPCGDINAWCCPNTGDCQPLAYDPCCVHVCSEYNQCSCHPWTCCDVSNANIWIVYSSTDYTFDATVAATSNPSCNDFFDGSVTINYNSGLPSPVLFNWDNGVRTGNILQQLEAGIYSLTVSDVSGCSEVLGFSLSEPPALTSALSVQNVTCFGLGDGYIDVSVAGGVPPYTYSWLDGNSPLPDTTQDLTNLGPGNYAVTITDANGCVSNEFNPVTSPDEFNGVITLLDLGCPIAGTAVLELCCYGSNTGSAVLELSGGTAPVNLVWSNGATTSDFGGLTAGTYSVTAYDANGCSFSRDFTLGQPDEIVLTTTSSSASCGQCNGSATVNVAGGSGGYSWLWPPSAGNQTTQTATNLCAGSYTVIVNDLFAVNCFQIITVSVSNVGGEVITTSKTDASCFGVCDGTASVSLNCSAPPCTVQWFDPQGAALSQDNDVSNLCGGSYSVVITNASGCITSETVDIEQSATIISNLSIINETCDGACDGLASAAPTGGSSPYTYQWLDGSGMTIAGQSNNLIIDLCSGDYTLVITDASGCSASFPFNISSLNNMFATTVVTQYLCFNDCNGSITAAPAGGVPPYSFQWFESGLIIPGENGFNLTNRCAGIYTVQITDQNGCTYTTPDIFINEPAELSASISSTTDLTCTSVCSGSATITASGGSGNLTYKWFNNFAVEITGETGATIANLCAGNHFVEVADSNGCSTGLIPFTINDINPLTVTVTASNVSCNGAADGTIDIEVGGGFPPYNFSWNGGAFITEDLAGLVAGNYSVVITDSSGCSITQSATITEPDAVSSLITIKTYGSGGYQVSCFGSSDGQLTANATGGTPPYSYQWDDPNGQTASSAIGLGLGTYSVTITDANGCTTANSETLSIEPGPFTSDVSALIYPSGLNISCFGASDGSIDLTVTGGEPPFIFNWTYNGLLDAYLIEDPTGVPAGLYAVNVVDTSLGCITRDTIVLTEPSEIILSLTPSIYPSGSNVSTVGGSDGSIDLTVSGGVSPYTFAWSNGESTEDIDSLTAGTYECTVTDFAGCQAIASITLREPQPSVEVIDTTICEGASVFAGGNFQTESGTYVDSLVNIFGLDSIVITNLTVLPASRTSLQVTICNGQSFFAGGSDQTESGIYYDTLSASNGCDSIVATDLTVLPSALLSQDISICEGDSFFAGGSFQTVSGTYYDTLVASNGCDSIVATTLAVSNVQSSNVTASICSGDSLLVGGEFQTQPGLYYDTLSSAGNCDSIIITELIVLPNAFITLDVAICDGESYLAGGAFQTESGIYYDTLSASNDCDSIVTTNLTILPNSVNTLDVSICDGDIYFAGGAFQTEKGTYFDTLVAVNGCDSIIITNLTVLPASRTSIQVTICNGQSYFAGGADQTESGTYFDTLSAANGCDSIITTELLVTPSVSLTFDLVDAGCGTSCSGSATVIATGGNLPYTISWSNGEITAEITSLCSGSYDVTVTDADGCEATGTATIAGGSQQIDVIITAKNNTCNCADQNLCCDGQALAVPSGGVAPYAFTWSNGATTANINQLCQGNYEVTVTDANGCSNTASVIISAFEQIEVSVTSQGLSPSCGGNRMCELNFGDFPPGTILNEQYASYGIHISGNAYGTFPDKVIIYNADGNGPDPDLETASGHVAILPENLTDADGNGTVDIPNDQGSGGVLTITFDYERTVTSFVFVDKERGVPGTAKAYDVNNNLIKTVAIPNLTNGSVQTIAVNATGVRKLVFDYRDSGGITDILFDCNPRCCDGSATATATGGNPPLTYEWSNGGTTATIDGLCPGSYTVTVTDADGCTSTQTATVDDCELSVSSLTIVNEHFGGDVAPFTEGMTISLDTLCPFNLRANLCLEPVGSVKFILNGATYRVEEYIPYSLAGDNPTGDYHDWVSSPGNYTLEVIPYSGPRATGTAGETFTSTFTVIGQPCSSGARLSSVLDLSNGIELEVYPIPFNEQLIINLNAANSSQGTLRLLDVLGREVITRDIDVVAGRSTIKLDMSKSMPEAVYFLEVRIDKQAKTVKVIKAQ